MMLDNRKPYTTFKLFTPEECERIISSLNQDKIELRRFVNMGSIKIDAFRINHSEMDSDIEELIFERVGKLSDYELEQVFILKYSEDTQPYMKPHYDICTHTLVINLNNDFEGGQTYFPVKKFKLEPKEHEVGTALYFKGDTINSWHSALPVTSGVKYSLNIKYHKKHNLLWWVIALGKFFIMHKLLENFYNE